MQILSTTVEAFWIRNIFQRRIWFWTTESSRRLRCASALAAHVTVDKPFPLVASLIVQKESVDMGNASLARSAVSNGGCASKVAHTQWVESPQDHRFHIWYRWIYSPCAWSAPWSTPFPLPLLPHFPPPLPTCVPCSLFHLLLCSFIKLSQGTPTLNAGMGVYETCSKNKHDFPQVSKYCQYTQLRKALVCK